MSLDKVLTKKEYTFMDMIEIKKGSKYRVISGSGDDKPMITDGEYAAMHGGSHTRMLPRRK